MGKHDWKSNREISSSKMNNENQLISKGQFYFIFESSNDDGPIFILEDKTKRGLEVREKGYNIERQVETDVGIIYNLDGIATKVNIRWYFPQTRFSIKDVQKIGEELEKKYKAIREMTCPDD